MESKKDCIRRLPLSKDLYEEIVNGNSTIAVIDSEAKTNSASSDITTTADSKGKRVHYI